MTKLPLTAMLLVALAAGDPCATIDKNGTCLPKNRSFFCVNHHVEACAEGTICDPSFHALHPNEAPCIDIMKSYGCNATTFKCEQTLGISSLESCEASCKAPAPRTPTPTPRTPTPAPALPTLSPVPAPTAPVSPTPTPRTPTPAPALPTLSPVPAPTAPALPTPAPRTPTPAPALPTPAPRTPTPAPALPTLSPVPAPTAPALPTPAPRTPTPAPALPTLSPVPAPTAPVSPTPVPQSQCTNVEDFACVSDKGFCLSQFYFPCSHGTKCSATFHRFHPHQSPCIGPEDAYECNRETLQCVSHGGYQSLNECEETCKATPAPTPAPEPRDCEDVPRFKCLSKHGYCRNHIYFACPRRSECSTTFHNHHPFQDPCIDSESSWSCNRESSQCLKNTGTMDRQSCEEQCNNPPTASAIA